MILHARDLDAFVAESDRLGGPGSSECEAYWYGFSYRPNVVVDQDLDPFSDAYVEQQLELYHELSGRRFDQVQNEQAALDPAPLITAVNPYDHPDPSEFSLHVERLSRALRLGAPRRGAHLLDMGCGWGLSSEVAAYAGLTVTAVDINPQFVDLVNGRASRMGHPISAEVGTFDDYVPTRAVDMILFYECLHHALRPWTVLERLTKSLVSDGCVALAGEPVNMEWWRHWGMRLDALSVYCIRKFGWFESGWSLAFIRQVFAHCGLTMEAILDADARVGYTLIGRPATFDRQTAGRWLATGESKGIVIEGDYGVIGERAELNMIMPVQGQANLRFHNFRSTPLHLKVTSADAVLFDDVTPHGDVVIAVPRRGAITSVKIEAETWVPDVELGNGDHRSLSIHLAEVYFV